MAFPATNFIKQSAYRKRLKTGDVFVLKYPDDKYVFGRIVSLSASAGGFDDCIKIHIYDIVWHNSVPPTNLVFNKLMFAPLFINRLGFSRGYMPVVTNIELDGSEENIVECYHDVFFKKYLDKDGCEIAKSIGYEGVWGLSNYLVLDDEVSEKLGLEVIQDERT